MWFTLYLWTERLNSWSVALNFVIKTSWEYVIKKDAIQKKISTALLSGNVKKTNLLKNRVLKQTLILKL